MTLEGAIADERLREGLRVIAENTRGVKAVHDRLAWVEPNSGFLIRAGTSRPSDELAPIRAPAKAITTSGGWARRRSQVSLGLKPRPACLLVSGARLALAAASGRRLLRGRAASN